MNWDFVLPGVKITDTVQASEPAMSSEQTSERFAAFYQRSARPLWAYLARVSGDPSLADDLMHESYVRFLCASSPSDGALIGNGVDRPALGAKSGRDPGTDRARRTVYNPES